MKWYEKIENRNGVLSHKIDRVKVQSYLNKTDWVEPYLLRHELKLEPIPSDSSKWDVISKRAEARGLL